MPTPAKLAAALSAAKPAGTMPSDENETIDVALRSTERGGFELGGRSGRVVTFSDHPAVHKGFRVLKVDGKELDNASAADASAGPAYMGWSSTGPGGWCGATRSESSLERTSQSSAGQFRTIAI